ELRFWIEDPHNGVGKIRSEVLLKLWDAFHENGIEFPFPQRDVNFRLADPDTIERLLDQARDRNQSS
ncbi:MAG: mechanosensitive ion channel protein MscS, partial [Verrucomicrobiota bacterium]